MASVLGPCRVLFEVASLEREATLPHEACLRHLAATIRTCHKIHSFAGGFEQDQSDLFDKASLHMTLSPTNPEGPV